ncbi:LacI family DNA-binding transcriptional regulator [Sediminibacillus dalangtanensis]|uniref:LacI family DNA-binding transcriptional regulator n=1 Tax=Sediminibacillus dalangtanensis TaxID=2729421 RepID=A0ABX7VUG6_9BACI|nr:LacI family DNA-binding transcriptional regulator [Sediminibacillus dalangtanensis]QTM99118.1 LacI family DNA-binding transcriptional regulator [Sediminibacillus dalangtanensis]
MANIREIAGLAGVSVSTVSRVLNNHPYVRDEKRQAVYQAMERLDYHRNLTAIHLSKGSTNLLGVVLPSIETPYFSNIVEGIAEEGLKHDLQLVLIQTNYHVKKELEALELLRGNLIDGLIFTSRAASLKIIKDYIPHGPIILCEDSDQTDLPSVSIPHEKAFMDGLDYLLTKGHTKIAYTLGRKQGTNSHKRTKAYQTVMDKINQPVREKWVFDKCLTIEDGIHVMESWCRMPERPTAFLVTNDQVAAGMVLTAKEKGILIPEDLAILSFDNQQIAKAMHISTIDIPIKQMGKKAVQFIQKTEKKSKVSLPFQLIERATV